MPRGPPRQRKKRNRNKSSPGEKPTSKKHRTCLVGADSKESDSEGTIYFDIEESDLDSNCSFSIESTPLQPKMAATFSKEDLKEIGAIIVEQIKHDLVKEIKNELQQEIKKLCEIETAKLHEEISSLQKTNIELSMSLKATQLELDELEQYGRRMCLNISGIPGDTHNASEDVERKIIKHANDVGIELTSNDLDKCHRIGKPKGITNRTVIVKFTNSKARQKVYASRKRIGDGIFVQENLTRFREKLSFEARQLVRAKKLSKTWIAGCKVFASMPISNRVIHIKDMSVVEAIQEDKNV